MALTKINASADTNIGKSVTRAGGPSFNEHLVEVSGSFWNDFDSENGRLNPTKTQWYDGAGTAASSSAAIAFNAADDGGALKEITIINRGSNNQTLFYGINQTGDMTTTDANGAIALNDQVTIQGPITSVWFLSPGTGAITASLQGNYYINPNTV